MSPDPAAGPDGARSPDELRRLAGSEPGYPADWWERALRSATFSGGFPVTSGGSGTFADLVAAIDRLAAAALPSPVHNGLVQSGFALVETGDERAHREHLVPLLSGARRYAFCLAEPGGGYDRDDVATLATRDRAGWMLDGTKCFVPYGASADVLLVVARTGSGHTLLAVDATAPGVARVPIPTIGLDRQCEVRLDRVRLPESAVLGPPDGAWEFLRPALDRARVALAADMVGAADAALRHTVDRVKSRRQWGVPIGSLQAVKHHCANMLMDVTASRAAVERAVEVVDSGGDPTLAAAAAKAVCSARCRRVSATAHQLCGGEGIYADSPLHLWFRRIKAAEPVLGSPRAHRSVVAAAVLDAR